MVRTNTVVLPGSDAAVIRVKETRRSLAMSLDGNGRYSSLDARAGARLAVVESARNVVCSGAKPLAVTNCLNFASPERPEVMGAFSETIDGIADACRALGTPVTGGNVSFYNETEGKGIYATPVIGMLGVVEDARHITTQRFKAPGDQILLLGRTGNDLGGSEFLACLGGDVSGHVPKLDLDAELAVQRACLRAIQAGSVQSAHDCSDGGLAIALAESCFSHAGEKGTGARIRLDAHSLLSESPPSPLDEERVWLSLLFGESPSRIIVSARPENVRQVSAIAEEEGAPCAVIGEVVAGRLTIELDGDILIDEFVAELDQRFQSSLPGILDSQQLAAAD